MWDPGALAGLSQFIAALSRVIEGLSGVLAAPFVALSLPHRGVVSLPVSQTLASLWIAISFGQGSQRAGQQHLQKSQFPSVA